MVDTSKLVLFPIDVEYSEEDSELLTKTYCITEEGKNIILVDRKFLPYFYVVPNAENVDYIYKKLKSLEIRKDDKIMRVQNVKKQKKFLGKQEVDALKVAVSRPSEVVTFREVIKDWENCELREADIPFVNRYLIDNKILLLHQHRATARFIKNINKIELFELDRISVASTEHLQPKVLALDIETNSKLQPNIKEDSIISISFYGPDFKRVVTWKTYSGAPDYVHFVSGEIKLLEETKRIIESFSPQVIVGYNSTGFDFQVILERLNKYKLENNFGWDNSKLLIDTQRRTADVRIPGYLTIDCLPFIRNILASDMKTNQLTLDSVAKELLGYGKTGSFGDQVYKIWEESHAEGLRKLSEYNLRDSEITYKLFYKIFETLLEFTKLTGIHTRELGQMVYSQLVEWYLIINSINRNRLANNRPSYHDITARHRHTYSGAFVVQPEPGIYTNITLFDFRSLYPSIIVAHNIDPDTMNCKCCKSVPNKIRIDAIDYRFCKEEQGFIPSLIKDLIGRRDRVKEIMARTDRNSESYLELKARQYALKIIANAFYGYLGFPASRWYSIECARSITAWGRKYIHEVIKKAEVAKLKVIYGDTDSVFLQLKDKTVHSVKDFLDKINKDLPDPIELEYEGFFKTGIFPSKKESDYGAKKRYALLAEDGSIKIKGLESVRGDWSELAKEAQRTVLQSVLKERSAINAEKYISGVIKDIKRRKVDLNKLAIRTRITKSLSRYKSRSPHVVAAELALAKGKPVLPGMFVSYIVNRGSGPVSSRIALLEDADINSYDSDYYINQQIIRAVYKIFELFDISEEQLTGGQTTLGNF